MIEFDLFSDGIITMQKRTAKSCSVCGVLPGAPDGIGEAIKIVRHKDQDVCEFCRDDNKKGLPWVVDDDEE